MTNNKSLKLTTAVAVLLVTLATIGCLIAGIISPVIAVLAMLMPVWLVANLCLWCTAL